MKKLLNNSFYAESKKTSFGFSLIIHITLLCALFVRIAFIEQEKRRKKEELAQMLQQKMAEPVLLYYTPPSVIGSNNKKTQASPVTNKPSKSRENTTSEKTKAELNRSAEKAPTEKKEQTKKISPKTEPIKKIKTEVPTLLSIPKKPTIEEQEKLKETEKTHDSQEIRSRKLTLADLFKTMPHFSEKEVPKNEGPGSQLVIAQGDMRYYTIIKKNVEHMNQVFGFHGGHATMLKWAQEGLIKKNVGVSIILNKQGDVLQTIITSSSGYKPFDELTKKTVAQASPFPPLSKEFKEETFRLELTSGL